jgi:hypothetical protein
MVTLETVLQVVPVVSLVIVGAYYSLQIRNQNRTRQAQLFMQAYSTFIDREFQKSFFEIVRQWKWDDYDDFWQKYGPDTNSEEARAHSAIGDLVKKGILPLEIVESIVGVAVVPLWEKWDKIIKQLRIDYGMPRIFEDFEYLYNRLLKYYEVHPELMVYDGELFSQSEI